MDLVYQFQEVMVPSMPVLLVILVCAGAFLKLIATACYNLLSHPLKPVPGPLLAKILPYYMTPALLEGRRAQTLLKLHQMYGPVVRVGPNEVSVSDFRLYRDIYSAKGSTKEESFYKAGTMLGHENIFSMRNKAQHAARRKMQNQPYSQQAIDENEGLILAMADRLLQRILHGSKNSETGNCTTDVFPLCGLFSLEVICKTGFNKDISQASDKDGLTFLNAMDDSAKLLPIDAALPFLKKYGLGEHVPGFIGHTFRQFKLWEQLTRKLFQEFRLETKQDSTERFIGTPLLVKEDTFLGRQLNTDEAVEEAMGLTFAGTGTTATTLIYLLYNLSVPENRHWQLKLREELQATGPSLREIKDLPFLNAVIKETMRLNPTIISTLPRILDVPLPVQKTGIVLPRGTVMGMQNYVHHRDPTVYPDPHSFNPERWMGVDASSDLEKALTPFSLGPRNCIGQNLARAELLLAASSLFRKLDLRLNDAMRDCDMDMEDRFNIAPRGRKLLLDVHEL